MALEYRVSEFQPLTQRLPFIDLAFYRILVFKLSFDFPINLHLLLFCESFLMRGIQERENILKIRVLLGNAEFIICVKFLINFPVFLMFFFFLLSVFLCVYSPLYSTLATIYFERLCLWGQ